MNVPDTLFFAGVALEGMGAIVAALGDTRANVRPYPGANSPYVLLTHCLGVVGWWGGVAIAGRADERDRAAEFRASGPVAPLLARLPVVLEQLDRDLTGFAPDDPPRAAFTDDSLPWPLTQRGCLLHLYEELAQHHGQMQVLRDVIVTR